MNNFTLTFESTNFGGGRINATNNACDINYFITDHLGSTRVIVDANGTVKAQYNYYPFGKQWEDVNLMANTNRYTFSGKEKQTVRDLGFLDFGARMYSNSEIPIFTTQDPLAEKKPWISPYVYCRNNPLRFIDPDGMDEEERIAAIDYIKSLIGSSYSKMDCSETVDKAIRESTDIGTLKTGTGIAKEDGIGKWNNGVALIVSNSDKLDNIQQLETGNVVTFKSGRSDHKGENGQFDHIGMVTEIIKDDSNNITAFNVVHSSSSKGVIEQKYDLDKKMPGYELTGGYRWDTQIYSGGSIPESVIERQGQAILPAIKGTNLLSIEQQKAKLIRQ
jgi:RHS repeat-associated protein